MTITVKLFAILRDKAGVGEFRLPLPAATSAAGALEAVVRQYPALSPYARRVTFAVNLTRVAGDEVLKDGDELALLPPVSGG